MEGKIWFPREEKSLLNRWTGHQWLHSSAENLYDLESFKQQNESDLLEAECKIFLLGNYLEMPRGGTCLTVTCTWYKTPAVCDPQRIMSTAYNFYSCIGFSFTLISH